MSVRVVLDLLDQFTNTRVLSLFHTRMWQSRYSEVQVAAKDRDVLFPPRKKVREEVEEIPRGNPQGTAHKAPAEDASFVGG